MTQAPESHRIQGSDRHFFRVTSFIHGISLPGSCRSYISLVPFRLLSSKRNVYTNIESNRDPVGLVGSRVAARVAEIHSLLWCSVGRAWNTVFI